MMLLDEILTCRVQPNAPECVAFHFPASEFRNIDYAAYLALLIIVCAWTAPKTESPRCVKFEAVIVLHES